MLWSWYNLRSSGFSFLSGKNAWTSWSTKATYSSVFFEVKTGALATHRKQCRCSEPGTWNSTRIAYYLTFPNGPSTTISTQDLWKFAYPTHYKYDSLVMFYCFETFFAGFQVLMHAQCIWLAFKRATRWPFFFLVNIPLCL